MSGVDRSSPPKSLSADHLIAAVGGRGGLSRLLRFALVGSLATATYLVVSLGLSNPRFHLAPWAASLAGFAISFAVSYFGHLFFTYRAEPDHVFYGPRFALATLALILIFSALSQVLATDFNLGRLWSNLLVAALFPPCSFLLHTFWSFAARKGERSEILGPRCE
ncbi:MAG: GtrA family protein [Pseudomonadota bacterium]